MSSVYDYDSIKVYSCMGGVIWIYVETWTHEDKNHVQYDCCNSQTKKISMDHKKMLHYKIYGKND